MNQATFIQTINQTNLDDAGDALELLGRLQADGWETRLDMIGVIMYHPVHGTIVLNGHKIILLQGAGL